MPEQTTTTARASASPRTLMAVLFALSLVAGAVTPLQGRVNSALSSAVADPILAALMSFSSGLAAMVLVTLLVPSGRRAASEVLPALRRGQVRWWYYSAGFIGACLVFTQSLTIPVIGVAVFTVAMVTGQVVGGMGVDRLGLTPAGVQRIGPRRLAGAALALAAVLVVVWPQLGETLGGAANTGGAGADAGAAERAGLLWLLMAAIPVVAGFGTSVQQVFNGRQSAAYGSPIPVTLINFLAGTALLGLIYLGKAVVAGASGPLPAVWWMYMGGPLGCVFIGVSALLVPRIGAFLTTLGLVAGQLLGSLLLDTVAPVDGAAVSAWTVVGTLGALAAVVLASWSGGVKRVPRA
ncbi:DMT family transporter [Micrococcus lylae]|uniref:DMT family transporter n=1 Tax=Micrococcus lylae TaxID=1273 RepID=UPI0021557F50|nr:DMT family transporter [Micrococcus lylae]WIK81704.1 DMT family transporter [Micrococcus lylae]